MTNRRALLSGAENELAPVEKLLADEGYDIVTAGSPDDVRQRLADLSPGAVDLYIQLPGSLVARGDTVLTRVRHFLTDGLMSRFDGATEVLPYLSDDACVVLVSGNHPPDSSAPDNHRARLALLHVLGSALLMERPDSRLTVAVVDHQRTPEEIVEITKQPASGRIRLVADLEDEPAGMSFSSWRDEILALNETSV